MDGEWDWSFQLSSSRIRKRQCLNNGERREEGHHTQEGTVRARIGNKFTFNYCRHEPWLECYHCNIRVTFTPESGLVMIGEKFGSSLYLLDINHTNEEDQVSSETCAFLLRPSAISPGITTWHRRFAHVHYPKIIKMATNDIFKGLNLVNTTILIEPCSGCAFGKHQRSPFLSGTFGATYPGEMIHSISAA
jgi:hypothetical protein